MSRSFSTSQHYLVGPAQTFAMMCDAAYLDYVVSGSGGVDATIEVVQEAGRWHLTLDRTLPAEVPSYARAIVGEHVVVRESRVWEAETADGRRVGSLHVTFDGAPVEITGDLTLGADDGSASLFRASGRVKASIPLIGGKVEEFARDQLLRFTAREEELAAAWLARK